MCYLHHTTEMISHTMNNFLDVTKLSFLPQDFFLQQDNLPYCKKKKSLAAFVTKWRKTFLASVNISVRMLCGSYEIFCGSGKILCWSRTIFFVFSSVANITVSSWKNTSGGPRKKKVWSHVSFSLKAKCSHKSVNWGKAMHSLYTYQNISHVKRISLPEIVERRSSELT